MKFEIWGSRVQVDWVYFDHNATTRVSGRVWAAMEPWLRERHANPSARYAAGRQAREAVERARGQVAAFLGAEEKEVVFTSGGTEGAVAALESALRTTGGRHVVISAVEHAAVRQWAEQWEQRGIGVSRVPVDRSGKLEVEALPGLIRADTAVVSVMWANNETGVVHPVARVAEICRARKVLFHTDGVQAPGRLPVDVGEAGADYASFSAHKMYGPAGVGALVVRRRSPFLPLQPGGGQERGRRGGTENVAGIVGYGAAAAETLETLAEDMARLGALRERLEASVRDKVAGMEIVGGTQPRICQTSFLRFEGITSEGLLALLEGGGVAASAGAACSSGALEPSPVLTAMGCARAEAEGAVRFSLGRWTTEAEVDRLAGMLPGMVARLREGEGK